MDKRPFIGIGVLLINNENQILLGKRKNSHGDSYWAPPGGHLEFGESFEDCAVREVLEETALTIEKPKFFSLTNDFFKKEKKHYISIFMLATYPNSQEIKNCEPHKVEEWQWVQLFNLPDNLFLPLKNLVDGKGYGKKLQILDYETIKEKS